MTVDWSAVKAVTIPEGDVKRVAIDGETVWEKPPEYDYYAENLAFDGTNYIDTGVKLFSSENISKDFELECVVSELQSGNNTSVIVGAMYEISPYPGFVIRTRASVHTVAIGPAWKVYGLNDKILITRTDGVIKLFINDVDQGISYTTSTVFDWPVTLGCEFNAQGNAYRYAVGKIDYIKIKFTS